MTNKREYFAKFGIATKGIIYLLIGGLSAMTTLGLGGKETGSLGAFKYLAKQVYGQVILAIIAIGLTGYVLWRLYQTFIDKENNPIDFKTITKKIGFFFSALFYGYLSYTAIKILLNVNSSNGGSFQTLLDSTIGQIALVLIGLGLLAKAMYQLYQVYSGKYKEKIQEFCLDSKRQKLLVNSGQLGLTTRGIVIAIMVYLIFKSMFTYGKGNVVNKEQAFQFLKGNFGDVVFISISIGLIAYGVYMLIKAKYSNKLIKP